MTRDLVMRAASASGPFNRVGWFFEPKFDGYRGTIEKRSGRVTLRTKSGMDVTKQYPAIVEAARNLPAGDFVFLTLIDFSANLPQ